METIKSANLLEMLLNVKGCQPITLCAFTDARLRKTGNPFPDCVKFARVNGMIGASYQNSVNAQREREGSETDFTAQPLPWGQWFQGSRVVIEHKGAFYVRVKCERSLSRFFMHRNAQGLFVIVPTASVQAFIPERAKSATQDLERDVIVANYGLSRISTIAIAGKRYRVRDAVLPV